MRRDPLTAFYAEWEGSARTERARRVLALVAAREPSVDALGAVDLAGLVGLVEAASSQQGQDVEDLGNAVVSALVKQFELDDLVGTTIIRILRPGLLGIGRRMHWGSEGPWRDRAEFTSDLLGAAWRHVHAHAGESLVWPCRVIVEKIRRSLRTDSERHRRYVARNRPLTPATPEPIARGTDELTELARGLALLAGGVIDRRDAALLMANRVLGYRLSELAAESSESIAQLRYRRRRAEEAVCR